MADEDLEAGAQNVNLDDGGEKPGGPPGEDGAPEDRSESKVKLKLPLGLTPITLLIGVLALVSSAVSVTSMIKAHSYRARYELAVAAARDPANLSYYQEQNLRLLDARTFEPGRALIIYGSDLGQQWSTVNVLRGDQVINRSIAKQNLDQMLLRFEQDVISLAPQAVLLMPPLDAIVKPDWLLHELRILGTLAVANGVRPVLATMAPIPEKEDSIAGGYVGRIRSVNRRLHELCSDQGWTCFDLFALLAGEDHYLRPEYTGRSRWPNAHGYGEMNRALEALLDSLRAAPVAAQPDDPAGMRTAAR